MKTTKNSSWSISSPHLLGGIQVTFIDDHAYPVRLWQLWTLDRHKNWVAPPTSSASK